MKIKAIGLFIIVVVVGVAISGCTSRPDPIPTQSALVYYCNANANPHYSGYAPSWASASATGNTLIERNWTNVQLHQWNKRLNDAMG